MQQALFPNDIKRLMILLVDLMQTQSSGLSIINNIKDLISKKQQVGKIILKLKDLPMLDEFVKMIPTIENMKIRQAVFEKVKASTTWSKNTADRDALFYIVSDALIAACRLRMISDKMYPNELLNKFEYFTYWAFELFSAQLLRSNNGTLPHDNLGACIVLSLRKKIGLDSELRQKFGTFFKEHFFDKVLFSSRHPSEHGIFYPTDYCQRSEPACAFNYLNCVLSEILFSPYNPCPSANIIREILEKSDMAVAGGSVIPAVMMNVSKGRDVDLFPIANEDCSSRKELIEKTKSFVNELSNSVSDYISQMRSDTIIQGKSPFPPCYVDWAETNNAFTLLISEKSQDFKDLHHDRTSMYVTKELQIVKRLFRSVLQIILSFDVAPARCAYYKGNTYISLTAMYAFVNGAYFVDPSMASTPQRLSKYLKKGFTPMFPHHPNLISMLGATRLFTTHQLYEVRNTSGFCCAAFLCDQELLRRSDAIKKNALNTPNAANHPSKNINDMLGMTAEELDELMKENKDKTISGMSHTPLPVLFLLKRHSLLSRSSAISKKRVDLQELIKKIGMIDEILEKIREKAGIRFDGIPLNNVSQVLIFSLKGEELKMLSGRIEDRDALVADSSWKIKDPTVRLYAAASNGGFFSMPFQMVEYLSNIANTSGDGKINDNDDGLSMEEKKLYESIQSYNIEDTHEKCMICCDPIMGIDDCAALGCAAGHIIHRKCKEKTKSFAQYSQPDYCPLCSTMTT